MLFRSLILLTGLFTAYGKTKALPDPVLGAVVKEEAAWKAGLRPDDRIVSLDGQKIDRFYQMLVIVRESAGKKLKVEFLRNGVKKTTEVTPTLEAPSPILDENLEATAEVKAQGKLNVLPTVQRVHLNVGEAWVEAWQAPIKTVEGLLSTVAQPSTAKDKLGGPGSIVAATASAVDGGFLDVVSFAAVLSISVGIFNLLPVYPLDGGQMVVALAEMLRGGRRLSMKVQTVFGNVGFLLVLALFACVILIDVNRFIGPKPAEGKKHDIDFSEKMKD